MKKAFITGITGQDGSYLAELLLSKDYKVYGLVRRTSTNNKQRIEHLLSKITLVEGDLLDCSSLYTHLADIQPDEIYNLAAQSHVGTSFTVPQFTFSSIADGTLNLLEAFRSTCPGSKFYQASSSEMFGETMGTIKRLIGEDGIYREVWAQDEKTRMLPQSPYGVAKLAAHHLCRVYRQMGLFICSGLLFNHECAVYDTPLIIKYNDKIDIKSIYDIALEFGNFNLQDNKQGIQPNQELFVWDHNNWTKVKYISWSQDKYKGINIINGRNSVYTVSDDHICILDNEEKKAKDINIGDKNSLGKYPTQQLNDIISLEEAELMGMLVGDGSPNWGHFTNSDSIIRDRFNYLFNLVIGEQTKYYPSTSGFTGEEVGRLDFNTSNNWFKKYNFYTLARDTFGHPYKCVPTIILNSSKEIMNAFLVGYNLCDGLKSNKCTYQFKNFKTNSPILAQGLLYLISNITSQEYNITIEQSNIHGKMQLYYSINLLSNCANNKGNHLLKNKKEIKKIIRPESYHNDWWFDLETESGKFTAGVGIGRIHNSPRRGLNFVTRKITNYIGLLENQKTNIKLKLGNLNANRDWGHAKDYVRAMWMMLQHNKADDYVVSTGETHSVKELCDIAFSIVNKNYENCVEIDKDLYRPAEVHYLLGDSSKIRNTLGWTPEYSFKSLIEDMVESDIQLHREHNGTERLSLA